MAKLPITETVTIINNSGKIITSSKHILSIFKEAKAAYKDKKDSLRRNRQPPPVSHQSSRSDAPPVQYYDEPIYYDQAYYPSQIDYDADPAYDDPAIYKLPVDCRSRAPSATRRTHVSRRASTSQVSGGSRRHRHRHRSPSPTPSGTSTALTKSNLKAFGKATASRPTAAPKLAPAARYSPYAETVGNEMILSRPTLAHPPPLATPGAQPVQQNYAVDDMYYEAPGIAYHMPQPELAGMPPPPPQHLELMAPTQPQRARSDSSLHGATVHKHKDIDMHLAYGDLPPNLADRHDLDAHAPNPELSPSETDEEKAQKLLNRVHFLIEEAHCIHHTATAIIAHLQKSPDAAAAVALTLAELSAVLGKMSPAFLSIVKGGFPAVYGLLACPQFLIAAGVAVGVTIVMFGGWKIVKRVRDAKALIEKDKAVLAIEADPQASLAVPMHAPLPENEPYAHEQFHQHYDTNPYYEEAPPMSPSQDYVYGPDSGMDEALVVEEELGSIESWRRGIVPFGADETVDEELISPLADQAIRDMYEDEDDIRPSDSISRAGRALRSHSTRMHPSHRSHYHSHRPSNLSQAHTVRRSHSPHHSSSRSHYHNRHRDNDDDRGDDDRRSRASGTTKTRKDRARSKDRVKSKPSSSKESVRDSAKDEPSVASSSRNHRSSGGGHRSSSSRSKRSTVRAIEDGRRRSDDMLESVLPSKGKDNMLKMLFKKKKEKENGKVVSVMV